MHHEDARTHDARTHADESYQWAHEHRQKPELGSGCHLEKL
jgi:hypothetical protein